MIEGCRNVVFHDGGLKNLPSLVALTVIDVGEVAFQFGSFNQAHVSITSLFGAESVTRQLNGHLTF